MPTSTATDERDMIDCRQTLCDSDVILALLASVAVGASTALHRSEERRVGKECRN